VLKHVSTFIAKPKITFILINQFSDAGIPLSKNIFQLYFDVCLYVSYTEQLAQLVNFFYLAPTTNIVPGYLTGSPYFGKKKTETNLSYRRKYNNNNYYYIIIIIILINCIWVDTRWQWLYYMYTKYDIGYY
jgi:hypothetical protein